ncbi:MAG: hypothetical protein HY904_23200 [Deltaproteobacteria bacterium]|nr:hypothetical protein [Deltaproteobacteria bacterium]
MRRFIFRVESPEPLAAGGGATLAISFVEDPDTRPDRVSPPWMHFEALVHPYLVPDGGVVVDTGANDAGFFALVDDWTTAVEPTNYQPLFMRKCEGMRVCERVVDFVWTLGAIPALRDYRIQVDTAFLYGFPGDEEKRRAGVSVELVEPPDGGW